MLSASVLFSGNGAPCRPCGSTIRRLISVAVTYGAGNADS